MNGFNQWFQGINTDKLISWGMVGLAALISISVHESAHGLSAYWLGDDTAKRMGRISLNPLKHFDPVGFLMMVVAGFGYARPVPVNPYRMTKIKKPKVGMALTAAAGPLSNILLALIFGLLAGVFEAIYVKGVYAGEQGRGLVYYLNWFSCTGLLLNAGLAVFNLLPISPLDGSKVLAILLPDNAHRWLMRYERYGFLILIALLYLGILSGPLAFLRDGLVRGVVSVTAPVAKLLTGSEFSVYQLRDYLYRTLGVA